MEKTKMEGKKTAFISGCMEDGDYPCPKCFSFHRTNSKIGKKHIRLLLKLSMEQINKLSKNIIDGDSSVSLNEEVEKALRERDNLRKEFLRKK